MKFATFLNRNHVHWLRSLLSPAPSTARFLPPGYSRAHTRPATRRPPAARTAAQLYHSKPGLSLASTILREAYRCLWVCIYAGYQTDEKYESLKSPESRAYGRSSMVLAALLCAGPCIGHCAGNPDVLVRAMISAITGLMSPYSIRSGGAYHAWTRITDMRP